MKTAFTIRCFLVTLLIAWAELLFAQDLHFSQFYETPLLRNPSLAGIFEGDIRVQGIYRDQWNSITNAYRTGSFNAEYKMPVGAGDDFITAGVQALFDKAGSVGLTTSELLPALNYHKSLSKEKPVYLSLGFMGGLVRKSVDVSRMTTDQQYMGNFNPGLATGENMSNPAYNSWDASVGISFNTAFGTDNGSSLYLGWAMHHLNRPRNSFYRNVGFGLDPKYVFSAGVKFRVTEFTSFTLQADQSLQGPLRETIAGVLYSFNLGEDPETAAYTVHGGGFLRWGDALIPVIKLDKRPISVGISYDINISPLKTVSQGRGGFELSFSWVGFLEKLGSSREKVLCPRF